MWQHSLSVENVASSPRQGQPHPSLSKGFRAYRISFANIPRRRISVYFLPPRPNPIYRLPIGGYGKGTGWSHAATFIVDRYRCTLFSPRTGPIYSIPQRWISARWCLGDCKKMEYRPFIPTAPSEHASPVHTFLFHCKNNVINIIHVSWKAAVRDSIRSKVLGGEGGGLEGEGEPFSRKVPLPPPIFHPSTVRRRAEAGSGRGCPGPRARTRRAWRTTGPR